MSVEYKNISILLLNNLKNNLPFREIFFDDKNGQLLYNCKNNDYNSSK